MRFDQISNDKRPLEDHSNEDYITDDGQFAIEMRGHYTIAELEVKIRQLKECNDLTNIIGLDYSLTMQDSAGKRVTLNINADSIRELVATGMPLWQATEEVEGNAFGNAIARNEINKDAWLENQA